MKKFAMMASVLSFLAVGSLGIGTAMAQEANGQPLDAAQAPVPGTTTQAPASDILPDVLSVWANQGIITAQAADEDRAQIEQQGAMPGTFAYDQLADVMVFPSNNRGPVSQD